MNHIEFREKLIKYFFENKTQKQAEVSKTPEKKHSIKIVSKEFRKRCKICPRNLDKKIQTICEECNVYLCRNTRF